MLTPDECPDGGPAILCDSCRDQMGRLRKLWERVKYRIVYRHRSGPTGYRHG